MGQLLVDLIIEKLSENTIFKSLYNLFISFSVLNECNSACFSTNKSNL